MSLEELVDIQGKKWEQKQLDKEQDRELRNEYSGKLFWLMAGWLVFVAKILILQGYLAGNGYITIFKLGEPILIALITTTTINVLGLFYIVSNNIFPKRHKRKKKRKAPKQNQ